MHLAWPSLISMVLLGCSAAPQSRPPATPRLASSDFDLQKPDHDPAGVCRYQRAGCIWYERGPDFGPPGRSVTFSDQTPSIPYGAEHDVRRLSTLVRECLQRAHSPRGATYKVWVSPHGRVTRLEARSSGPQPRLRRCSRLLTHRRWPKHNCTYGFAIAVLPGPQLHARHE